MAEEILIILCGIVAITTGQLLGLTETDLGFLDSRRVDITGIADPDFLNPTGFRGTTFGGIGGSTVGGFGGSAGQLLFRSPLDNVVFNQLQQCQRLTCTLQFIPPRCRYTPVYQSGFGQYCLGCPEDVCQDGPRLTQLQRSRRRRIRRRMCRNFGICVGQTASNPSVGVFP